MLTARRAGLLGTRMHALHSSCSRTLQSYPFRAHHKQSRSASRPQASNTEIEIKLRLPDEQAHHKVMELLKTDLQATHHQENFFFDGANQEITSTRTVLRCRFYNVDQKALLTCKGKQELVGGVGRGSELETEIDPINARRLLQQPNELFDLHVDFVDDLQKRLNLNELECIGGFRNLRRDYAWEGFKLELDETQFEWGTVYEIEVETERPEDLQSKLEGLLKDNDIDFSYSKSTKFHNFVNKTLE